MSTGRGVMSISGLSYGVVRVEEPGSITSLTLQDVGIVMPGGGPPTIVTRATRAPLYRDTRDRPRTSGNNDNDMVHCNYMYIIYVHCMCIVGLVVSRHSITSVLRVASETQSFNSCAYMLEFYYVYVYMYV